MSRCHDRVETIEEKSLTNMEEFVHMVFSHPPMPPKSNQPQLELDSTHEMFQFLGDFFTRGTEYLFGENVSVSELSEKDIGLIQQYVNSFGWEFIINPQSAHDYPRALPWVLSIPLERNHPAQRIRIVFQPLL